MSRLLRVILLTLLVIAMWLSQPRQPASPAKIWDYNHRLIHPTDPPKDLSGNFLSSPLDHPRFTRDNGFPQDKLEELRASKKKK